MDNLGLIKECAWMPECVYSVYVQQIQFNCICMCGWLHNLYTHEGVSGTQPIGTLTDKQSPLAKCWICNRASALQRCNRTHLVAAVRHNMVTICLWYYPDESMKTGTYMAGAMLALIKPVKDDTLNNNNSQVPMNSLLGIRTSYVLHVNTVFCYAIL